MGSSKPRCENPDSGDRQGMIRLLQDEPTFSDLLSHKTQIQVDPVDQLFNSTEERLAHTLLLLAHIGKEGESEAVIPQISQEALAEIVGTTPGRVSYFMNKFRKLGLIDYNSGGMEAHSPRMNGASE